MTDDPDQPAVVILADAWTGRSGIQKNHLRSIGAEFLAISPGTTDQLQPLDVNYNRQLKIFYNRIVDESFYENIIQNVTS